MAASLKARFGEDAEPKPGATGQFDVLAGGVLIFSKKTAGRFPLDGEVETRFAALKAGRELPPLETAPAGPISRLVSRIFG